MTNIKNYKIIDDKEESKDKEFENAKKEKVFDIELFNVKSIKANLYNNKLSTVTNNFENNYECKEEIIFLLKTLSETVNNSKTNLISEDDRNLIKMLEETYLKNDEMEIQNKVDEDEMVDLIEKSVNELYSDNKIVEVEIEQISSNQFKFNKEVVELELMNNMLMVKNKNKSFLHWLLETFRKKKVVSSISNITKGRVSSNTKKFVK